MKTRTEFSKTRRIIVKIGSSLLTKNGQGVDLDGISAWVSQIADIRLQGIDVLLVSSGAVAEGMCRLGWQTRPHSLHELQAVASIGQMGLIQVYESHFQRYDLHTAQVLLTHEDLSDRKRYLNARSTLLTLLQLYAVPVINENDVVVTDEIRFGDNDTLAALVANLVEADLLVILTDQIGLFEQDPTIDPKANLIQEIGINDPRLADMAGGSHSGLGRGGMHTKVSAAKLAARSGTATIIASGSEPDVLHKVLQGELIGTLLVPDVESLVARKRWLAGQLQVKGSLILDSGAVRVLKQAGKSLLPIGVTEVDGSFQRGELVACVDNEGYEVARGLVNYNSDEARLIKQQQSSKIEQLLGYIDEPELIHRDNLVLV